MLQCTVLLYPLNPGYSVRTYSHCIHCTPPPPPHIPLYTCLSLSSQCSTHSATSYTVSYCSVTSTLESMHKLPPDHDKRSITTSSSSTAPHPGHQYMPTNSHVYSVCAHTAAHSTHHQAFIIPRLCLIFALRIEFGGKTSRFGVGRRYALLTCLSSACSLTAWLMTKLHLASHSSLVMTQIQTWHRPGPKRPVVQF